MNYTNTHLRSILVVAILAPQVPAASGSSAIEKSDKSYKQAPAFLPSGLDDPRLAKNPFYAKGTSKYEEGIKNRYSDELCRYAHKLLKEKKYKEALRIVNLSFENQPIINLGQAADLRIQICMEYAGKLDKIKAKALYELVVSECTKGTKGWHPLEYYLPKIDALLALGRTAEAIQCSEEGYNYANGDGKDVAPYAAILARLTGSSKPSKDLKENVVQAQNEVAKLVKYSACPSQKELENIFGAKFEVSFPDSPNLIRRGIAKGNAAYSSIDLKIPHKITKPSQLILYPRPDFALITEEMVRQWFGNKEAIREPSPLTVGLTYEYPWGEVQFSFSPFGNKAVYEIDYRWAKSSECDGLQDPEDKPKLSLDEKLKEIDKWYALGERKYAFQELYWQVGKWSSFEHSSERLRYITALRNRLISWRGVENKPEVVAYLKIAPAQEIIETMWQIISKQRLDFFTAKEHAKFPYPIYGELDHDFNGQLVIDGFAGERIISIEEKTEAGKQFVNSQKMKLPFKGYRDGTLTISPLPGPLIDQIADEQDAIVVKRVAERKAIIKAKYIEDSKDPEIVKQREIQARRDALDPDRVSTREAFESVYMQLK